MADGGIQMSEAFSHSGFGLSPLMGPHECPSAPVVRWRDTPATVTQQQKLWPHIFS